MRPTCAWCGWRDSAQIDPVDGKPVCGVCLEPPSVASDWTYEPAEGREIEDEHLLVAAQLERMPDGRFVPGFIGSRKTQVVTVLRSLGQATRGEIVEACGVPAQRGKEYDSYAQAITRLVRDGLLVTEGEGGGRNGRIYRLREAA